MSTQNSTFPEVVKLFVIQRNEMPNLKEYFLNKLKSCIQGRSIFFGRKFSYYN